MNVELEVIDNVIQPKYVEDLPNGKYEAKLTTIDIRTQAQNSSLWLWLAQIATMLNKNNITIDMVLKPDIKWNKDKIKAVTFDEIIDSRFNKKSSTKLSKEEFSEAIEIMIKAFAHKGIELPKFPSIDIRDK